MEKLILEIKNYLIDKYNCHTIILYGSYANGNYTDESDIDIICFSDNQSNYNDTSIYNGKQLDVWIYNSQELNKPEKFLHILTNKVLLDTRNLSSTFLNKINEIYLKGPEKLDENKRKFLKDWLKKMLIRTQKGDIEGNYRHYWMITDSLELYFELKGLWFLGPKKSLRWLSNNDIYAYNLFNEALNSTSGSEEAKKLIEFIIGL